MICEPVIFEGFDFAGLDRFHLDLSDALIKDCKQDVANVLRRASLQIPAKKLYSLATELDYFSDSEPPSPADESRPIRILMLHGRPP